MFFCFRYGCGLSVEWRCESVGQLGLGLNFCHFRIRLNGNGVMASARKFQLRGRQAQKGSRGRGNPPFFNPTLIPNNPQIPTHHIPSHTAKRKLCPCPGPPPLTDLALPSPRHHPSHCSSTTLYNHSGGGVTRRLTRSVNGVRHPSRHLRGKSLLGSFECAWWTEREILWGKDLIRLILSSNLIVVIYGKVGWWSQWRVLSYA